MRESAYVTSLAVTEGKVITRELLVDFYKDQRNPRIRLILSALTIPRLRTSNRTWSALQLAQGRTAGASSSTRAFALKDDEEQQVLGLEVWGLKAFTWFGEVRCVQNLCSAGLMIGSWRPRLWLTGQVASSPLPSSGAEIQH